MTGFGQRMQLDRTARPPNPSRIALGVAILGILAWYLLVVSTRRTFVGDEYYHVPAVRGIAQGDWEPLRALPMPPAYHFLAALPVFMLGGDLWVVRLFNPLLGIVAVFFMHAAIKARCPDAGPAHLLRFAWNPLLLPYWVFVYTDVASLLGVVIALNFHVRRRYLAAAGGLLLACLIRQSNVVWVALFIVLGAFEWWQTQGTAVPRQALLRPLIRRGGRVLWPYLLTLMLGVGFVVAWDRVMPAPRVENRFQPNIAQFYILALTAALLWAPTWLEHLTRSWSKRFASALARPSICAALVAAVGALELEFRNPHPWNVDPHYLRNWPLRAMTYVLSARYVLAACIVVFVAAHADATWRSPARRTLGVIWAFSLLFLLPHYLVDPRYYIIPIVLVDFFTPLTAAQTRRLTAWYLVLTLAVGTYIVGRPGGWSGVW